MKTERGLTQLRSKRGAQGDRVLLGSRRTGGHRLLKIVAIARDSREFEVISVVLRGFWEMADD
jgi:hypothetical protein